MKKIQAFFNRVNLFFQTRFSVQYQKYIFLSAVVFAFSFCGLLYSIIGFINHNVTLFVLFTSSLCSMLLSILMIYHLYNTIIIYSPEMEKIERKYSLIDSSKKNTFSSSFGNLIHLVDTITEREYSNKILQKQAELEAMKSQINPHFLYNTLDSIRGYATIEEAPVTADMIEVLSRIFRYTVSHKQDMVTISQELDIAVDYIKIQEYRSVGHIVFLPQIENDVPISTYKIPKLILQPLIENAIKHGFSSINRDFVITVHAYITQSSLVISVQDNGRGMSTEKVKELNQMFASDQLIIQQKTSSSTSPNSGTGIALSNINQRIKLIYGPEYGLRVYSSFGEGTDFQIILPRKKQDENNYEL